MISIITIIMINTHNHNHRPGPAPPSPGPGLPRGGLELLLGEALQPRAESASSSMCMIIIIKVSK